MNGGTCNEGNCLCPDGYGGSRCETLLDACFNVTCQNGGVCIDGECDCVPGFEGPECEIKSSLKFLGTWSAYEICSSGDYSYTIVIQEDPAVPGQILINNLGNFVCNDNANMVWTGIVNENTFTVLRKTQCDFLQIEATGKLENSVLLIDYTATVEIDGHTEVDECRAQLIR